MHRETPRTTPLTYVDMLNEVAEAKKIVDDKCAAIDNCKNADRIDFNTAFIHNVAAVDIDIPKVIGFSHDMQQVAVTDFRIARDDDWFTIGFKYAIGDGLTKSLRHKCSTDDHEYIGNTLLSLPEHTSDPEMQIGIKAELHNLVFDITLRSELFILAIAIDVTSDIGYPE